MPTYEYECKSCGVDFDVFQSMSDEPLKVCPTCGKAVRRKISKGTGIIFKGSGFYKNDNRKSSGGSDESSRGGSAVKSESKPAPAGAASTTASSSAPASQAAPSSSSEAPKKEGT
jgi:putative FmdB family regulatory protein